MVKGCTIINIMQVRPAVMKLTPIFLIVAQASPPAVILSLAPIAPLLAQLAPDNSLGTESSVVTPVNQTTDRIDGGAARGGNLFHSFSEFNVDVDRSVYFANPPAIQNILTRVTGGNPSNIFGTLGVLGDANLFLINPGGIVFGADARLDISGSFFATTGDGIKLGRDGLFSATDLDPNKLLHVRPEALFGNALVNQMAKLNNRGNLAVGTGSALVLHGGEVSNSGSLTAPSGTVMVLGEQIGLLDNARINVSSSTGGGNVFIGGFLQGRGNIPTAERTYIGPDVTISADAAFRGDGGNVNVWASEVTRFHGNISARGGRNGGDGGFVEVSGHESLIFRGNVDTTAAVGKAGTLLLDPRNIIIANGSPLMEVENAESIAEDIFSGTEGAEDVTIYESQLEGLSGNTNVVLQATNDIVVEDLSDNSLSLAPGTGDITFRADADRDGVGDFTMADPADTINTNGRNIAITGASLTLGNIDTSVLAAAPDGVGELLSTAAVVSTGPGEPLNSISGNLLSAEDVDLYQIYLTGEGTFSATTIDGSSVDTQLFLFDADGLGLYGNDDNRRACDCSQSTLPGSAPLTPTTPGIYYLGINVDGVNPVSESGEIFAAATRRNNLLEPTGAGSALPLVGWEKVEEDEPGDYTITLTGVEAASATFAEVIDNTVKSNSGAITLTATNGNITAVDLNGASFSGAGGEIRLDAAADIVLNGSSINASGVVSGGSITLNSGGNINLNSSFLTSSTNGVSDAGKVTIIARDTVRFNGGGASSQVNSNGSGSAGGIEITTGSLSVVDGALLSAHTFGAGDAGTIFIAATEKVLLRGENSQERGSTAVVSEVRGREESGSGNAGGIEITTGSLSVMDGARVSANTFGEGDAGRIVIAATEKVLLRGENSRGEGSAVVSQARGREESDSGNAGGIEITTGSLELMDGALLSANTFSEGDAGTISIAATEKVLLRGEDSRGFSSAARSEVRESGSGDAGGIDITTGSLELMDGAQLSARTEGEGDAGKISIAATERVLFAGLNSRGSGSVAFSQVGGRTRGVGNSRGIEITTGSLELMDGARVSTSTGPLSEGNAGPISIAATERVLLRGENRRGLSSEVLSQVGESAEGSAGEIEIKTGSLELIDGGQVSVSTAGVGNAGKIEIEAVGTINISGLNSQGNSSGLFAGTTSSAVGETGDITISTSYLNLGSAGVINARTQNVFTGGDIEIDTDRLSVTGGAQILSSSFSSGDAGTVSIDATEQVTISAIDPTYNSRVAEFGDNVDTTGPESAILSSALSTGTAGTVTLKTGQLQVSSDAEVSVSSADGIAGSVNIIADEINLNNGTLRAETALGDQGNITIDAPLIVLQNDSGITTNATGDATGGNITIATENLVARDDSDISANAIFGRGGNILITASGVFLDTEIEITAASDLGIDGIVEIQAQIDPARGLVPLNSSPIDASSLISKGCEEYRGSEFIITGRGGIPPHPFETLPGEVIWLDWRALTDDNSSLGYSVPDETSPVSEVGTPEERELPDDEIRQAQGWLQLPEGTVVLTAYPVKMTPVGPVMQHPGCQIIMGESKQ